MSMRRGEYRELILATLGIVVVGDMSDPIYALPGGETN